MHLNGLPVPEQAGLARLLACEQQAAARKRQAASEGAAAQRAAGPHVGLHVGQEEDGRHRRGRAERLQERGRLLHKHLDLRRDRARHQRAEEDRHDLRARGPGQPARRGGAGGAGGAGAAGQRRGASLHPIALARGQARSPAQALPEAGSAEQRAQGAAGRARHGARRARPARAWNT